MRVQISWACIKNLILALNSNLHGSLFDADHLVVLLDRLFLGLTAHQVLRLAILVLPRLRLVAPIALHATLKVVVLALTADPATIGEVKVVLAATTLITLHA